MFVSTSAASLVVETALANSLLSEYFHGCGGMVQGLSYRRRDDFEMAGVPLVVHFCGIVFDRVCR